MHEYRFLSISECEIVSPRSEQRSELLIQADRYSKTEAEFDEAVVRTFAVSSMYFGFSSILRRFILRNLH